MKKLIALLLALIMMLGLVACGGSTTTETPDILGGDTTEEPTTGDTAGDTTGDTTEDPGEVLEPWDGDYENATFDDVRKYGFGSTNWDGSLPLTTTGEKIEWGIRTNSNVTDYDTNPLTVWLEEQTGIDIVVRQFSGSASDVMTQMGLMLSGGEDMPDIMTTDGTNNGTRADYVGAGYFVNCAGYMITDSFYFKQALDLACKDNPKKYATLMNVINFYSTNQRTGQVYGPVTVQDNYTDSICTEAMINTKWLEKLNLKAPTTIDELYDVLVAFRDKDPNGNGKKDEIPMIGMKDTNGRGYENYLITPFMQYTYERRAWVENGVTNSLYDQDEYRQALIFIHKLVKEELLSPMTFTINSTELKRLINAKPNEDYTVGIACAYINGDYTEDSNAIYDYEPLPALADASGRGGWSMFEPPIIRSRWSICWDCENPLLAWRLLDFMYSPEAMLRQRLGERGVDWDWIQDTPYADKAKGNGLYGGDASYVVYNQGFRKQSRWFVVNTYQDESNWQLFVDPDATDYINTFYKKSAQNVALQQSAPQPEEEMPVFLRTPEEDEIYQEYNTDLINFIRRAKNQFAAGQLDPNNDADWNQYLRDLEALHFSEIYADMAQVAYDRMKADMDAYLAKVGG